MRLCRARGRAQGTLLRQRSPRSLRGLRAAESHPQPQRAQGYSPLPIWPCMREDGGRPVPMASLRLPWECRLWLEPLWDSAPGPRFMFWVGG